MINGRLMYNGSEGRYGIVVDGDWHDEGLHCGAGLSVLLPDGTWTDTRIELRGVDEWYLVGTPYSGQLDNIPVQV